MSSRENSKSDSIFDGSSVGETAKKGEKLVKQVSFHSGTENTNDNKDNDSMIPPNMFPPQRDAQDSTKQVKSQRRKTCPPKSNAGETDIITEIQIEKDNFLESDNSDSNDDQKDRQDEKNNREFSDQFGESKSIQPSFTSGSGSNAVSELFEKKFDSITGSKSKTLDSMNPSFDPSHFSL